MTSLHDEAPSWTVAWAVGQARLWGAQLSSAPQHSRWAYCAQAHVGAGGEDPNGSTPLFNSGSLNQIDTAGREGLERQQPWNSGPTCPAGRSMVDGKGISLECRG